MPITMRQENTLKCDYSNCSVVISWNPQVLTKEDAAALPVSLKEVVGLQHPASKKETIYCSKECALLALDRDEHLPPVANLIVPANAQDAVAAAHNANEAKKLHVVR